MAEVITDKFASIVIDSVRVDENDVVSFVTTAGEAITGLLMKIGGSKKDRELILSITGDDFSRNYCVSAIANNTIKAEKTDDGEE
jgi:hypothetical protein